MNGSRTQRLPLAAVVIALVTLPAAPRIRSQAPGTTRTYFIAADEVDWDFAPSGSDRVEGTRYHFESFRGARGMLNPNNTVYRKALYRQYTDATFKILKPRPDAWAHLGALGPLIRAEVGDTLRITFKNNASRPYSLHPHGVFYAKAAEGAKYQDGTSSADRADAAVAPGATYTYVWTVPERAGPTEHEGRSAFWMYHSHVDEGRDINSGLIGPLIVTRRGAARPDGSPTDVDREFVVQFAFSDEHLSWYWDTNLRRLYRDPKDYDDADPDVHIFHHFWTINSYMDANGPLMSMRHGERVRWYLFANPNEEEALDIHTPHWHGQTVVVNHMRMDMVMLTPMMSAVADMVPDNVGTWLLHCHMPGHFKAGMRTLFQVVAPDAASLPMHRTGTD